MVFKKIFAKRRSKKARFPLKNKYINTHNLKKKHTDEGSSDNSFNFKDGFNIFFQDTESCVFPFPEITQSNDSHFEKQRLKDPRKKKENFQTTSSKLPRSKKKQKTYPFKSFDLNQRRAEIHKKKQSNKNEVSFLD